MLRLFITTLLLQVGLAVYSQEPDPQYKDPQNMRVDPENTDCHLLPESFQKASEALEVLETARFYYDQSIKTTRKSGLMWARFVSCDFKKGYLIIRYDSQDMVYPEVDLKLWEQFQQTADIDGFYFKRIEKLPKLDVQ